jgi:hypothetical protein
VLTVGLNGSLVYEFILANPTASWTAHLTNPAQFYFDLSGDGVSEGVTREGHVNRIVIRPVAEVATSVSTEFYITVEYGGKTVEIDLNVGGSSGSGHRYVIRQIPN